MINLKDDDGRAGPDKSLETKDDPTAEEFTLVNESIIESMLQIPGLDRESIMKVRFLVNLTLIKLRRYDILETC